MDKIYAAIDLKSFYASVECVERGLDPLTTNLVVADKSRTEKTICLAVSPSLKKYGIPGRPRLFEVIQKVKRVNKERLEAAKNAKTKAETQLEAAQEQCDKVVEEMKQLGVTPDTIEAEITRLSESVEENLKNVESNIPEV